MSSSFAELMKVAERNSQSSQKEALEAAKRREAALRRAREEQEKKDREEKEQQRKLMLRRIEDTKREEERKARKGEEARKRREDALKRREMDTELANRLPLAMRDGPSKSKASSSSSYIVTNSTAMTREEKRMARDPLLADQLKANRKSSTVKKRKDGRLPGGAINAQDAGSGSPSRLGSPAGNGLSARARFSVGFAPTLTKLNTEKRDLRTIEEITRDLKRNRMGGASEKEEVLSGEKAQAFDDWFGKKDKEKTKSPLGETSKHAADGHGLGNSSKGGLMSNGASHLSGSSATQRPVHSTSRSMNGASASTSRPTIKKVALSSGSNSRPAASSSGPSKAVPVSRKRQRERSASLESDMIDDDDEDDYDSEDEPPPPKRRPGPGGDAGLGESARDMIWKLMGKDRSRYAAVDVDSDDDMEASAADLWKEDIRSTKIAKQEDAEAEEQERRREMEKKRRKLEREKGGRR